MNYNNKDLKDKAKTTDSGIESIPSTLEKLESLSNLDMLYFVGVKLRGFQVRMAALRLMMLERLAEEQSRKMEKDHENNTQNEEKTQMKETKLDDAIDDDNASVTTAVSITW